MYACQISCVCQKIRCTYVHYICQLLNYVISVNLPCDCTWYSLANYLDLPIRCSSELNELVPLPYSQGRFTRYSDRFHDFYVTIPRCYKDIHVNSFFPHKARLSNSLPIECFPLTNDLSGFTSRINRHLLTVGSF